MRRLAPLLALAFAPALIASGSAAAGTGANDFYAVPESLAAARPGSLIRAARIEAPDGAKAWRVLYHSRTVDGRDIAVSGVVVAPEDKPPKGGRPILSWAHGTTGIADVCAPSKSPTIASSIPYVADFLKAGYVVAATDYEGLGTPGVHPFLVGDSEAHGVLDAARAARRLDGTGAGRDLVVFGHSQGGHAALFAGERARSYAPELRLDGVVAGAPAADLDVLIPAASAVKPAFGLMVLVSKGFQAAYPEADPATVLTPGAIAESAIAEDHCVTDVIRQFAGTADPVVARNPADTPPWPDLLHENSAGHRAAGAPLLVVQGAADQIIVRGLTDAWVQQACGEHDVLDYHVYDGADHGSVLTAARNDVLAFLAARLERKPARNNCP
ncbi:MAG TPA: lipase family protein [Acidimicrobiia bacterium]